MDSGHSARGSKAELIRIAAMRPTGSDFRVAEHEDGGTAQAHLIHAADTTKVPAHTPKLKAAAVPKHAPSDPQQDHRQTHPKDTDHNAHPTLEEEIAHQQHVENCQRDNSAGHHAIAAPAHRPHKPRHNHLTNDETDKHDHFRHQPHDQTCGNDYHVELGNLRASSASNSPLLSVRKLFSVANSSVFRGYAYSEAVTRTRHHPRQSFKERRQNNNILTPEMNLGVLFLESTASRSEAPAIAKSRRRDAETPETSLEFLFPDIDPASNQQHPRDHLGRSNGHRGHHALQDLSPVEGPESPDYNIEGPQHHNDQKQSE
ncbi:hypothetical protein KI688_001048 [Linnemannia hyalina]|uniref:Uncharacterized protein n=1 Tax=Linnemannia hyalina TaxID=64524 RepID=A0A9P8BZ56_9FUNG|nr:hypothetical protein KI688_001048 [Linnemannia hyalina]